MMSRLGLTGAILAAWASPAMPQPIAMSAVGLPDLESAPIAMLVDVSSGQVLHAKNPDRRFVPASITKAMTAYVAFEQIDAGILDPDRNVLISFDNAEEWRAKGSTMFLDDGDQVTVGQLLTGIMNVSANDASIMLARLRTGKVEDWLAEMNRTAKTLQMTNSHFGTPNGWPDEGRTFTTARDLVTLGAALTERHPQKYTRYIGLEGLRYKAIAQDNRDPLIGRIAGADGIKTGYTNESGSGYLGSAMRDGRRLVMVLGGTQRSRERDRIAREYIEWGFSAFEQRTLFGQGATIGSARVQGGNRPEVELETAAPVQVNLIKQSTSPLRITIEYDGPVPAPIAAGDRIATLRIAAEGVEPALVPLVAREDVPVADFWDRLWNGLIGWVS